MNFRYLPGALLACLLSPAILGAAPVQIAQESFEGEGGSIGFTTSVAQFNQAIQTDFFSVIPNNGTKIEGPRTLADAHGSQIFCAEDIDTDRTAPAVAVAALQSLTTNPVSIAGKINTQVRIKLAAPGRSTSAAEYENFSNSPTAIDFIKVEVSIDGAAFQRIAQFSPSVPNVAATLTFDADGNNLGDSTANPLTAAFQDFTYAIPTGNTVAVKVTLHCNGTGEYLAVDDIRIFAENTATNPPSIAGVPAGNLLYTEGSAATAIAPALTVTDSDSVNLSSATVVISQALVSGEDVLAATPSGTILAADIVYTAATGTLTITRSAPVAAYQTVLRSVTYRNSNTVNPSTSTRRVSFQTTDGVNASNAPFRDINVADAIVTQTIPFTESFETEGRGTRYAVEGGFSNPPSLFARTQPGVVTGLDGTWAFGVENVDDNPDLTELVTFSLNATGLASLTGSLRVAAPGGAVYDTGDLLRVEVSADGGPFQNVLAFHADGGAAANMRQDTTPADATNLGDGTLLTAALQTFNFNLPNASLLTVRIRAFTNIVGERILFDRLTVDGLNITFAVSSASGSESATPRTFTVTRTGATTGADTVLYATSFGTAASPGDFTATSGTLNFAAGETTKSITVPIISESLVELDETFSVALTNPSRGTVTGGPATGTITNDDSSVISLTGGVVTEGDTGTVNLAYTIQLTNPVDTAISFNRATQTTGTATSGTDFTAVSSTSTSINPQATSDNFTVSVIGDHVPESTETVPVLLSSLSAGGRNVTFAGGGATLSASGGVTDDDPVIVAGNGSLGLQIGVSGKLTTAALTALATGGEGRPLSVVSVQSGPTAGGGSVSLADGWVAYQPAPGFSGADSFTYTISDGFQTVTGTVNVVASNGIGQTQNILSISPEGAGNRLVGLGIPGRNYRWQTSSNLTTWTNLGSLSVCPASGVLTQVDPGPLPPTRFYRLIQP